MRVYYDFVDGEFSKNILYALSDCTAEEIACLRAKRAFAQYRNDEVYLTYKNLRYAALDDYADASGHSMRELIFGTDRTPSTHYTAIDGAVISALNKLSPNQLDALKQVIQLAHSTPMMELEELDPSPRYIAYYKTRKFSMSVEIPRNDLYKYRKNVTIELERFKKSNYSTLFRFAADYWPDLATVMGISLHWILGIQRHSLFCESAIGDELFDYFTLMEPAVRKMFVGYLLRLSEEPDAELVAFYNSGREGV